MARLKRFGLKRKRPIGVANTKPPNLKGSDMPIKCKHDWQVFGGGGLTQKVALCPHTAAKDADGKRRPLRIWESDMELRDKVIEAIRDFDDCGAELASGYADAAIATVQEAEADTVTTLRGKVEALREGLADDPEWICFGISDEAIQAGIEAWEDASAQMAAREVAEDPENHTDWDEGMIVAAIFKAVGRALLETTRETNHAK